MAGTHDQVAARASRAQLEARVLELEAALVEVGRWGAAQWERARRLEEQLVRARDSDEVSRVGLDEARVTAVEAMSVAVVAGDRYRRALPYVEKAIRAQLGRAAGSRRGLEAAAATRSREARRLELLARDTRRRNPGLSASAIARHLTLQEGVSISRQRVAAWLRERC